MICSWQSMYAVNYVDLTVYKKYSYAPSPTNALEREVDKIWNSFKSSLNENFVSNSINTEEFWNTLRRPAAEEAGGGVQRVRARI